MEIREIAACGIAERKFAVECQSEDLPHIYRILRYPTATDGYYDEDFLEDLCSQMVYIVGSGLEQEADEGVDTSKIKWEQEDDLYCLKFNELAASVLYKIFCDCRERSGNIDRELALRLMSEIKEIAPSILSNLPVINR